MARKIVSAGGILLHRDGNDINIVIVERTKNIEKKWAPTLRQLPKGGCNPGETLEETALREVLEETGFSAQIIAKAGQAQWSYERNQQSVGSWRYDRTGQYHVNVSFQIHQRCPRRQHGRQSFCSSGAGHSRCCTCILPKGLQ